MRTKNSPAIHVTRSFLPPIEEYKSYIDTIWESHHLTNNGPLLKRFESEIKEKYHLNNFQLVANGTVGLEISLEALGIKNGEVITTPFSYVATTSSILWQQCKPVFVDIDKKTLCIDPSKIEAAITEKTKAIMPVHVFGNPCDVEAIEKIAKKHSLKIIYDAAHAFGVKYKGASLLNQGDASIVSFHATKLFNTIEGGGIIAGSSSLDSEIDLAKRFGHNSDEHISLGTNAKASEFQAAMGLCNLKYIEDIVTARRIISEKYTKRLKDDYQLLNLRNDTEYNFAYYPVIFKSEAHLLIAVDKLNKQNIFPRRYFYPSLNTLPYLTELQSCPVSENISRRIICLPLYVGLEDEVIDAICEVLL